MKGTDWHANDTNEYVLGTPGSPDAILPFGTRPKHTLIGEPLSTPLEDAMHIYGDEVTLECCRFRS